MRFVDQVKDADVKASIAVGIADLCDAGERVEAVAATLRCDPIEARLLISRGRRIRREKASESV